MFDCYRELCEKGRKHFAALLFYFYYFLFFFFFAWILMHVFYSLVCSFGDRRNSFGSARCHLIWPGFCITILRRSKSQGGQIELQVPKFSHIFAHQGVSVHF